MTASPDTGSNAPSRHDGDAAFVPSQAQLEANQTLSPWSKVVDSPRRSLAKGELLYHQGDAAASTYLVESGLLTLSIVARPGRERVVGLAGPGDLIGAHTLGQSTYLDSAAALSQDVNVVLFRVGGPSGQLDADAQYLLGEAAFRHLQRLTNQLEDAEVPVPARIARTFLRLAERYGQANGDETSGGPVRLTLPLTHDTLAAMVGAARETTSATVEHLRRQGLVTGTRGRYVIQTEALQAFAVQAACS